MKNKSMFGTLKNVLTKEWQSNNDNLLIKLITTEKTFLYQVFSTYSIDAEGYYINTSFNSEEEYLDFLQTIKERSNHNYGIFLTKSDSILTLSSCITSDKRVVLHAKKIL